MKLQRIAYLGTLVGLYEAIAIVRWDWLMDDLRPWRLAVGVGHALLIIGLNIGLFSVLGLLAKRCIIVTSLAYTALICSARFMGDDRFDQTSLYTAGVILTLSIIQRVWPWVIGLLAVALATPGLWGRIPVYTTPTEEQFAFLLPGAVLTVIAGLISRPPRAPRWAAPTVITLSLLASAGWGLKALVQPSTHSDKPNVLFILVDTLRQDHVQPYGETTPTAGITRLSEEGTRYDDAITVIPKTTQSVAAFQTGNYPVTNGVRILKGSLGPEQQTLAEVLNDNGYSTAAFVHNGWVMRGRGFEQGFEQFWSFFELERAWGPARLSGWITAIDTFSTQRIRSFDGNTNAAVATDQVVDWLSTVEQPFYGYVHYFDPHWPYRPPGVDGECKVNNIRKIKRISRGRMMFNNPLSDAENERACELYRQEITYNADQVGRLLSTLDDMGVSDNTIVVFTADHGHSLGEHDYWYHHGEFLYDVSMSIPLIIKAPGQLQSGAVVKDQVRSIDVMPTLLALTDTADAELSMDGANLLTETAGPAFLETDISYFKSNKRRYIKGVNGKLRGVRTSDWKLIYSPKKGQGVWELYDLKKDPAETINILRDGQAPEGVVRELMAVLAEWIPADEQAALMALGNRLDRVPSDAQVDDAENTAPVDTVSDEELSEAERKMLQALGYVE